MSKYEDTIPSLNEQKGKILVLHDMDAPVAKKQGKTWIHFIRDGSGKVLKKFSPPAPPPGSGPHTYRYVLVDSGFSGTAGNNIQDIPVGEEIKSFVVEAPVVGGRKRKSKKFRKVRKTRKIIY